MNDTTNLPPLPEPFTLCYEWDGPYGTRKFSAAAHNGRGPDRAVAIYTAAQVEEIRRAAILQERERWQQDALRYRWLRDRGARFLREGDTFTDEEVDTAMNADARAAAIREGGK